MRRKIIKVSSLVVFTKEMGTYVLVVLGKFIMNVGRLGLERN